MGDHAEVAAAIARLQDAVEFGSQHALSHQSVGVRDLFVVLAEVARLKAALLEAADDVASNLAGDVARIKAAAAPGEHDAPTAPTEAADDG